jgi:carboxymethylenebutenolidase
MRRLASSMFVPIVLFALAGCGGGDDYAERMAREHADDAPVAGAAAGGAPAEIATETVTYGEVDGQPVEGFLARPDGAEGPLPGVVMIHEWWGLNENIRTMARRLASRGYQVLAVDLYGGETASAPEQARALMESATAAEQALEANLRAAYRYLAGERQAPRVAALGWCFGGGMALRTALLFPQRLDAAVIYYGHLVTDPEQLEQLEMPILGIFGAEDQGIPLGSVREFEAALHELGKDVRISVYEGAGHAFANPSGRNYRPEAAEDAWQTTLDFLDETLTPGS